MIDRFKSFYQDTEGLAVDDLEQVYHQDIIFKDPVHELRGIPQLHAYLSNISKNLDFCRFEYLDQLVQERSAYIKWDMHFRHPRLGKQTLSVRGMTNIHFNDKIHYHEDVYDMGQMIYENIPIIGGITKKIKRGLQKT